MKPVCEKRARQNGFDCSIRAEFRVACYFVNRPQKEAQNIRNVGHKTKRKNIEKKKIKVKAKLAFFFLSSLAFCLFAVLLSLAAF